jgi:hypothetical protein
MTVAAEHLPLVVGVTGHRDLRDQDIPELERTVAAVIAQLRGDYLDSETPLVLLSTLAKRADPLAARIALWDGDEKEQSAGGTTEVVTLKRDGRAIGAPQISLAAS